MTSEAPLRIYTRVFSSSLSHLLNNVAKLYQHNLERREPGRARIALALSQILG